MFLPHLKIQEIQYDTIQGRKYISRKKEDYVYEDLDDG